MTLYLYQLDNCKQTILSADNVLVLEVENAQLLRGILRQLKTSEDQALISIYDYNKSLNLAKDTALLIDFFQPNEISKTAFSKIQDKLLAEDDFGYKLQFDSIVALLDDLVNKIINSSDVQFCWKNEIEPKDFLKLMGFDILNTQNILDNCLNYISACAIMKLYKVIIFYNLKSLLDSQDITKLYKHCLYCGQLAIFIDSQHYQEKLSYENKIYVDKDLFDMYL